MLTVLLATAAASMAQTNTGDYTASSPGPDAASVASSATTNAVDYRLSGYGAGATNGVSVEATNLPAGAVRQLSLQDCMQSALQQNLDLQIERTKPDVALFALRGDYGGYDPILNLRGQHDNSQFAQSFTTNGIPIPKGSSDDNQFSGGLGGLLPWGMDYNLYTFTPITDQYGSTFSANSLTNGHVLNSSFGSVALQLTQPLLKNFWIDTTRLNIRVAKNRLKYSELGLKFQIMQTVTTVEQAYFDLIFNRENVVVQQKALELAQRLVLENQKKLEVGTLAPLDLAQAQAQAEQSRAALIAASNQTAIQENKLKGLITDQFSKWVDVALVPSGTLTATHQVFNRQEGWSKGLTQRPDLLQAKLDVEKQGIQLKYDRNQLFPQLDVFGTYGYAGGGQEFSDTLYQIQQRTQPFYTYGGQITLPLANASARNAVKSSKVTLQQLLLALKQAEQNIMIAIDNDIKTVQADYDQVLATRAQRQYEEQALDAEQKKLENGKSTTYTVLQVQRDLTTARGSEIQALDTYNKDLSQLSADEGSTLERLRINVQMK